MPLARSVGGVYGVAGLEGGARPARLRRRHAAAAAAAGDAAGRSTSFASSSTRLASWRRVELRARSRVMRSETTRSIHELMPLPSTERILLGPGTQPDCAARHARAGAPVLSHLDPDFVPMLDDVRASLQRRVPRRRQGADHRHVGHRHVGDGGGRGQHRRRRHARASSSSPATSAIGWRRSFERYGAHGAPHRRRVGPGGAIRSCCATS